MRATALTLLFATGCTVVGAVGGGVLGSNSHDGHATQDAVLGGAIGLLVDVLVLVHLFSSDDDKGSSGSGIGGRKHSGMFPSLY